MGCNQTSKLLHSKRKIPKKKKKRQPAEWEKRVANNATDQGLISKINKENNREEQ